MLYRSLRKVGRAGLAQSVERQALNLMVEGPSPSFGDDFDWNHVCGVLHQSRGTVSPTGRSVTREPLHYGQTSLSRHSGNCRREHSYLVGHEGDGGAKRANIDVPTLWQLQPWGLVSRMPLVSRMALAITTPRKCRCPSALAIAPDSTRMALAITTDSTHNIILRRPGRTLWLSLTISRSLHGTDVVTAVTTVGHIITVVCYQTHYRYIGIQKQYRQMVADDDS